MDLHEDSEKNLVTATFELPGIRKEDISIDIHDSRLTVSGETKISEAHEEDGYAIRERRFGKFSRTLRLPAGVKVGGGFLSQLSEDSRLTDATGRGRQGFP